MEQNYLTRAAKYLADLRKRRLWKRIVSGLGTAVVFCTVYALILPAITMTIPTVCGQEEHTHDASCYAAGPVGLAAQVPVVQQMCSVESVYADVPDGRAPYVLHVHSEFCYRDGGLVCTLPEMPEHIHEDSCYTEVRQLICGQEETIPGGDPIQPDVPGEVPVQPGPTVPAHQHGESCYEDRLICGQEETAGHIHTDGCYSLIPGPLTCVSTEEGHIHGESCYAPPERQLVCGQEEAGHTHTDGCYSLIPGPLTCVSTEEGHIHGESCYAPPERQLVCGQEEAPAYTHTHTPACYQRQLVCTLTEGQPDTAGDQNLYGSADLTDGNAPLSEMLPQFMPAAHVHTDACYETVRELTCTSPAVPHEHDATCYNELGGLVCGRQVLRSHVHNESCFTQVDLPPAGQPEDTEKTPACGKPEHTHDETCYEPKPAGPSQEQQNWDAIFWSNTVMDASDAVLESSVQGVWKDSNAMDQELLAALHNAAPADLTRFLDLATIQVDGSPYSVDSHGPMDAESPFAVALSWTLDEARLNSAGTMTYHYRFPEQIRVENIERRALSDAAVEGAVAYSVQDNLLSVTYRIPAESASVRLVLRASWAPELGENTRIQWSNGAFTDVTFAKPELAVTKTMGENGLRVEESGEVWADYTVTVSNTGAVAAKEITLTDTMESTYFHFARGGFEGGMDYSAAVQTGAAVPGGDAAAQNGAAVTGAEEFLTFENYDGGNTLTFPAFDLAAGESRVFRYKARMSAEDRAGVDKAIQDGSAAGETVRNTARAVCAGCGEEAELTASSQGTYNGLESKHIEDYSQTYSGETFDVTFTVNGDAQLPAGMTAEKLDAISGEGLTLSVKELDESDEAYQAFAQAVEPEAEGEAGETDSQLIDLSVLGLELHYNGVALDLADCEVEAAVTPNEALKNYREPLSKAYAIKDEDAESTEEDEEQFLGDKGFGLELRAFTLEEKTTTDVIVGEMTTTEPVEEGAVCLDVHLDEDAEEQQPAEIEPVTFAVENGVAAFSTKQVEYPEFNVVFYANLERLEFGRSDGNLTVIDTRGAGDGTGGKLPSGSNPKATTLTVDSTGKILTKTEETQIFEAIPLPVSPYQSLTLDRFNVLEQFKEEQKTYALTAAYILDANGNPKETFENITADDAKGIELNGKLSEGDTVKMVFNTVEGSHPNAAVFYDYDITDGKIYTARDETTNAISNPQNTSTQSNTTTYYVDTRGKGINSSSNYSGNATTKYGFGNGNTDTTIGGKDVKTDPDHYLNRANSAGFGNCTFGIAAPSLVNGTLAFAGGIDGPKIFNQPSSVKVEGKTTYPTEYSLDFLREGDTYTLRSVDGTSADKLNLLYQNRDNWNHTMKMYSNDFWPMDSASSYGADGHDLKFGAKSLLDKRRSWNNNTLPEGDYGADHNSYFGMQFSIKFKIPKGYIGPLDYCFFGDDDLWLYLEYPNGASKLICDIGGVHSSVGEYVDLWDYISKESPAAGEYKLHLFYTERGASGSTCWMQYTLPGVQSVPVDVPPEPDLSNLRIEKKVNGVADGNMFFNFKLKVNKVSTNVGDTQVKAACLYLDESGLPVKNPVDSAGNPRPTDISANKDFTFQLKKGESLLISNLPNNTTYEIWEIGDGTERNDYETTVEKTVNGTTEAYPGYDAENKRVTGQTEKDTSILVTYTNTFHYALPETGGPGTAGQLWYTCAALPMMAAAVVVYKRSRRKGGTRF